MGPLHRASVSGDTADFPGLFLPSPCEPLQAGIVWSHQYSSTQWTFCLVYWMKEVPDTKTGRGWGRHCQALCRGDRSEKGEAPLGIAAQRQHLACHPEALSPLSSGALSLPWVTAGTMCHTVFGPSRNEGNDNWFQNFFCRRKKSLQTLMTLKTFLLWLESRFPGNSEQHWHTGKRLFLLRGRHSDSNTIDTASPPSV